MKKFMKMLSPGIKEFRKMGSHDMKGCLYNLKLTDIFVNASGKLISFD